MTDLSNDTGQNVQVILCGAATERVMYDEQFRGAIRELATAMVAAIGPEGLGFGSLGGAVGKAQEASAFGSLLSPAPQTLIDRQTARELEAAALDEICTDKTPTFCGGIR